MADDENRRESDAVCVRGPFRRVYSLHQLQADNGEHRRSEDKGRADKGKRPVSTAHAGDARWCSTRLASISRRSERTVGEKRCVLSVICERIY